MRKWKCFSKEKEREKEIRYILSIDGGGIRGIIPAYVIRRLSEELQKHGDERPFYSHFDLIAGTSTGALIALGLSTPREYLNDVKVDERAPYPLSYSYKEGLFRKKTIRVERGTIERTIDSESLEEFYKAKGSEIFKTKSHLLSLLGTVFSEKYDTSSYEEFLLKVFKDAPLSALCAPTIAISFNTKTSEPYIFKSYDSDGFLVREAARASSAAPLYFAAASFIDRKTNEELSLIDGGLGANNPVLLAYKEARELYPNADEYRILSLSTCSPKFHYNAAEQVGGLTGWASPLVRLSGQAELAIADMTIESIPNVEYIRIWDGSLKHKIRLDDYSDESIAALLSVAEKSYEENKERLESLVKELSSHATSDAIKLCREQKLLSD